MAKHPQTMITPKPIDGHRKIWQVTRWDSPNLRDRMPPV